MSWWFIMFYKLLVESRVDYKIKEYVVEDLGDSFKLISHDDTPSTENIIYKNFRCFFTSRFNVLVCHKLENHDVNMWLITESLGA